MMIELEVGDIRNAENQSDAYALILKEKKGNRVIPIMIGTNEARSLVLEISKVASRRPSPHDLFKSMADISGYRLENVYIYKFESGVFFSYLRMEGLEGNSVEIDSRTSDAVTLALKYRVPIFMEKELFSEASLEPTSSVEKEEASKKESAEIQDGGEIYIDQQLSDMSEEELEDLLAGAVESEDFELASKIHEEIEKRRL